MTRRDGESYLDFVRRAAAHPLGRAVKLADNHHNAGRLDALDPATAAPLRQRYAQAREILLSAG